MILTILAIIGKIILIILCIIVVLLALVLFTPVSYKAEVVKEEEFYADGDVGWLFRVFHAVFSFKDGSLYWDLKLFGKSLKGLLTGKKQPKKKKVKKKKQKKQKKNPTIMPGEKPSKTVLKQARSAAEAERKYKLENIKPAPAVFEEEAAPSIVEKIRLKILSLRDKMQKTELFYDAYKAVKKRIFKLLKHILPKKISGYIRFGFEDPSVTGKSLAVICMFYPLVPEKLQLEPVFNEKVFRCNVHVQGRIFLIVVLVQGLKIYFNEKVKIAMGRTKGGK